MKLCLDCNNKILAGRTDKKFCNSACRNHYNNKNNYVLSLFKVTKKRAKKFNIPFNITIDDIVIPEFCPIFKIPIFRNDLHQSNNSPSLDKIIPELGYIKGNVWIISMRANRIKSDLSKDELILFCETMLNKLKL
jgi:hypothetical protein